MQIFPPNTGGGGGGGGGRGYQTLTSPSGMLHHTLYRLYSENDPFLNRVGDIVI